MLNYKSKRKEIWCFYFYKHHTSKKMLFFLWGLLILLGILFPKSKCISVTIIGFMIIAIGFRTQGADYIVYQNEFKWSSIQVFSDVHYVGYLVLEQLAHKYGLIFEQFRLVIATGSIFLMYFGIRKITINVNMVLALFLIYPFSHEAIQTRTFLANSLLIFALSLILKEPSSVRGGKVAFWGKKIPRYILFYIIAVISCTMHFEAAIYVLFLSLMLFLPQKYGKVYVIIGTICAFLLIETGILPGIVSKFNNRIGFWISGKTGIGIVIPIFITMVIWLTMQMAGKYCVLKMREKEVELATYKKLLRFSDFIFLLIPLFCYDITFNRLWRLFLVFLYIMIARIMPYKMNQNRRLWILLLLIVLFISICAYEGVFTLLYGFFENNEILLGMSVI